MGGRGASAGKGAGGAGAGGNGFVGRSVTDLGIDRKNIEEKLGLKLTDSQKDTLMKMFNGIAEKASYGKEKIPQKITNFEVKQPRLNDEMIPSKDVSVFITTEGNTGRYFDYGDGFTWSFIVPRNGGAITYKQGKDGNYKKTYLKPFDVSYGKGNYKD